MPCDPNRLHFLIPGPVTPYQRVGRGKNGHSYVPAESREYRKHARACAEAAMSRHTEWPLDRRYRSLLIATFPDRRGRDLDNVIKQVHDAFNKVLWNDDAQVDEVRAERRIDKERLGLEVILEVISDANS